jgi:hypothetical protein
MMSFIENLRRKIEIDRLAKAVVASMGPPGSGRKVDKDAMRRLLDLSGYSHRREREMDLFLKDPRADKGRILFLDNELPIYDTTVEDAVMRRNPLIKEMVSIRKIVKILNDKDILVTKKEDTVQRVRQECLQTLDLSYTESDIAEIAREGIASLDSNYAEGVVEAMAMFAELLGFTTPPKPFRLPHFDIYAAVEEKEGGEIQAGPIVLYSRAHNDLKFIEENLGSFDKEAVNRFQNVAKGEEKPAVAGGDVFYRLKEMVLAEKPLVETGDLKIET